MLQRLFCELSLVCLLRVASHWSLIWSIDWSKGCSSATRTLNKGWRSLLHVIHVHPYDSALDDNWLCRRVLLSENIQAWRCEGVCFMIWNYGTTMMPLHFNNLWSEWNLHRKIKCQKYPCLSACPFIFFKEMLNKWSVEIMGCEECTRHGLIQAQIVRIEYLYNLYLGEPYHKYVWYEFNCWCDCQSFYLSVILLTICHLCVSPFQWSSLLRHR